QRGKIQEESLYYEMQKHSGALPIMGVNTFLSSTGSPTINPNEVIRATKMEKDAQIQTLKNLHEQHEGKAKDILWNLQQNGGENIFEHLMVASKFCSLGQITHALYELGGQYRRNM